MATRAKKAETEVEVTTQEGEDGEDLSPEVTDVLSALAELEGANDASWKIFRLPPLAPGKAEGYCDTVSSAELNLKELSRRLGKGVYKIIGHDSKSRYLKSSRLKIAEDMPALNMASAQNSSGDVLTILSQRDREAADRRRELMLVLIPALAPIAAAFIQNRQSTDPVALLAGLKTLVPAAPQSPDLSAILLPLMTKMMDMQSGGDGRETNWMDLVKEALAGLTPALAGLTPALAGMANRNSQPLIPVDPPPATSPAQLANPQLRNAVSPTETSETPVLQLINWARKTLSFCKDKAARNRDPYVCAVAVLDEIPDGLDISLFVDRIAAENWFDELLKFDSSIAPYKEWFTEFRDELLSEIKADASASAETEPANDSASGDPIVSVGDAVQ